MGDFAIGNSLKIEKVQALKSLQHRLDCYESESLLMSKIMNLCSVIIFLIYDHYQCKTMKKLWNTYKKVAHQWVEDRRREDEQGALFQREEMVFDTFAKSVNFGPGLASVQDDVTEGDARSSVLMNSYVPSEGPDRQRSKTTAEIKKEQEQKRKE